MHAHPLGEAMRKMLFVQLLIFVLAGCVSSSMTEYNDKERSKVLVDSQQLVAELPNYQIQYHPSHSKKYDCASIGNSWHCKSR